MSFSKTSEYAVTLGFVSLLAGCSSMESSASSDAEIYVSNSPEPPAEPAEPAEAPEVGGSFTLAKSDPFSTFAADVDTASYDLYRSSLVNYNTLPEREWVRTEDFINYFDYAYIEPTSDGEHPFSIDLAVTSDFLDNPRALLRVGIQAAKLAASEKRPANLAFLVDISGSMQDPFKLPLVTKLLTKTLEVLDPEDRVAIVTYASGTAVALPSTPVSERARIEAVISDLSAGGSTNGAGGIQLAYAEVRSEWIEGGVNHVVLCTDGDFNVGVSSTDGLVELIEAERKSGVTFTAVGFGTGPNDAMLENISNHGNGIYGAIGTEAQAEEYAHERMLSTLHHVAKDMKIQVEFNPDIVWAYRLLGYENRAIADDDFRDDVVDAGEVGAGHRVTALYELAFDETELPANAEVTEGSTSDLTRKIGPEDLVQVRVRYKEVDASESDPAYEVQQGLPESALAKPDRDLAWAGAVAGFAEVLKGGPSANLALLPEIAAVIEAQAGRDAERDEFIELFQQARPLLEAR